MISMAKLRVLVTLAMILSSTAGGRPLPAPQAKRSPQNTLVSTSPVPPLPAIVLARESRMKARDDDPMPNATVDEDTVNDKRDADVHEHIHAHVDGHVSIMWSKLGLIITDEDPFHDDAEQRHGHHDDYYSDWWTPEDLADHSKHWASHHSYHDGHHYYYDNDYPYDHNHGHNHVHEHIHAHIHDKRDMGAEQPIERGLVGDLVKPLLAPLNVIPGFISISNLLFGDGVGDGGLLKKLGGLVLHVEATNTTTSRRLFAFSLMASKHERTQIYLSPVGQENMTDLSSAISDAPTNSTMVVKVTLPILDPTGMPTLKCASFELAPPSTLNLEACSDDSKESIDKSGTSQLFTYAPATGSLTPVYPPKSNDTVQGRAVLNNLKSYATIPAGKEDGITVAAPPAPTKNATMDGETKMKFLMHFTAITDIPLVAATSNGGAPAFINEAIAAANDNTPVHPSRVAQDMSDSGSDSAEQGTFDRRNLVSLRRQEEVDDEEDGSSIDREAGSSIREGAGFVAGDQADAVDSDEPSRVFLADTTVHMSADHNEPSTYTLLNDNLDNDPASTPVPPSPKIQTAKPCPCLAGRR